jgi:hypothetical protein
VAAVAVHDDVAVSSGSAGTPSTLTRRPATPDVASVIVGVSVTDPRQVPAASPSSPLRATAMAGGLVSIRNVRCRHDSLTPALSVARYSNVRTPLPETVTPSE